MKTDKIKQISYNWLPGHKENLAVDGEMGGKNTEVLCQHTTHMI